MAAVRPRFQCAPAGEGDPSGIARSGEGSGRDPSNAHRPPGGSYQSSAPGTKAGALAFFDRSSALGDHLPMPLIETEEAARRLARAIASDLSLYNEDKIVSGIQNDNLFDSLSEEIEEGRALYKRRVSPDLYPRNFYDRALVDILVKAKGHVKSKLW
jgi:hypothetical protein